MSMTMPVTALAEVPEGHVTEVTPYHFQGRRVGYVALCACGFNVVRGSEDDADTEALAHKLAPLDWATLQALLGMRAKVSK